MPMWGQSGGWAPYVSVAQRRREAEREIAKLRKQGQSITPVTIAGRRIASSFWGKAWCDNLESYRDLAYRLERGRSYVRNGLVIDLQIAPRKVTAMVSGSSTYQVKIDIGPVAKPRWGSICADCTGGIDSLVELLQGRFSTGVMERICRQETGLFPTPGEIGFACSCPDYASMCKHVAATLYGVGARLDAMPELLFRLRAVDENDLVAGLDAALPLAKRGPAADKVLDADDVSALFGLDMDEGGETVAVQVADRPVRSRGGRTTAARQGTAPRAKDTGKPVTPKRAGTKRAAPSAKASTRAAPRQRKA